jgi:RNA polymerase sigma factor (sigma-70 family)
VSTHADPFAARSTIDPAAVFAAYHDTLCASVRRVVGTSDANVEDACMFAWVTVLDRDLEHPEAVRGWLFTVAVREAIRLDRRSRRTVAMPESEDGEILDPADPRDPILTREQIIDAAAVIRAAGLTARQARIVGLQVLGFTYQEIAAHSDDSLRTVERQILRARRELADAHAGHEGEGGETQAPGGSYT